MDPFYLFTNQLAEEIARHSSTPTDEIDLVSLEEDVDEASSSIASSRNLLGGEREKRERIIVTLRVGLEGLKRRASSQSGQNYREVELEGDDLESQHQSLLVHQQDDTLSSISGTVNMLRDQAKVMGNEVREQNVMLEQLDHDVDRTGRKLGSAQKRMGAFIRQNQDSPASWCILILILILSILLFVIIFL